LNSPLPFGSYDLIERIHLGAMAEVFRAHDRDNDREVAIKRLLPSISREEEFLESFLDEANVASELVHPHIASIYEIGKADDRDFVALEYVAGRDLRAIHDYASLRNAPLPLVFILDIAVQICSALEYAQQHTDSRRPLGIVHGDVSPPNVLIAYDGTAKLINFGIANAVAKLTQTQVGTVKNKFGYFSPERALGSPIDARSEVFSVGVCLWELLTLERLFSGDSLAAILEKVRACDIPGLTDRVAYVPAKLERIVLKALAKNPSERYANVPELAAELVEFARTQNLVLDRSRAADYMQRVFADGATANRSNGEKSMSSDQKNSSDLDVFEGLARKRAPDHDEAPPPLAPPIPPNFAVLGRKTLVGMPSTGASPSSPDPQRSSSAENFSSSHLSTQTFSFGSPMPLPAAPSSGAIPFGTLLGMPTPPMPSDSADAPPGTQALPSFPEAQPQVGANAAADFSAEAAAPAKRPRSPSDVDMDWDEEDEKTSVFERPEETSVYERSEGSVPPFASAQGGLMPPTAGAFGSSPAPYTSFLPPPLNSSGAQLPAPGLVPPPAMSRTSTFSAPPPAGRTPSGMSASFAPPTLSPPTIDLNHINVPGVVGARAANRNWILYGGVAVAVAIVLSFFAASRRGGKVAVFAASATGKPLTKMAIYVDGVQKCSASPCTLDLDKGIHFIKASADGYAAQGEGTTVRAGDEFALNFKLERSSLGTGVKVNGKQDGVELFVDGKSIGPLPQEVKDLAPGPHHIGFKGSDRYAPEERSLSVDADEIKDLGTVSLKVLRGLASFDVRTPGVKVTLVSGKDRRQLTDFSQPVEIETSKSWTIEATRPGYDDFRQPITFEDRAEKTFVIVLQEHVGTTPAAPVAAAPAPAPRPQPAPDLRAAAAINTSTDSDSTEEAAPSKTGSSGPCTLNLNTIPVSNVLLDGRPIGATPKVGISAPAGTHNVLYVWPDARKLVTVTCRPGEVKTVPYRLNQP
jgi:serine/threonine protein kinase